MANVVMAWELGRGFGHLFPMAAVGEAFRRQGHCVTVIIPEHTRGPELLLAVGLRVEEIPLEQAPPRAFPISVNYSANLLRNGYWDPATVRSRVSSWRAALARHQPDLLLCDHAPAALLASRDAVYPRAAMGTGFTLPPLSTPMPALQPWFLMPADRLTEADTALLGAANPALDQLGLAPLDTVASMFDTVARFLCIESELDHYTSRSGELYWGAMAPPASLGLAPVPPEAPDSFVFVYLTASNRFFGPVLDALDRLGLPVLAYVGGGAPASDPACRVPSTITYLTAPTDLSKVASRCRLAITHGGTMTTSSLLKNGLPLLICPEDLEKAILGARLAAQGLARSMNWFSPVMEDLAPVIASMIDDSDRSESRRAFAAKYAGVASESVASQIVVRCEASARQGRHD